MTGGNNTEGERNSVWTARAGAAVEARIAFWWGMCCRFAVVGFSIYFLWRVRTILATVVVALIISCAAQALVDPLCRRRVRFLKPHTQRLLATIGVYVLLILGAFWSIQLLLHPFQAEFQTLMDNYPTYQKWLTQEVSQAQSWYSRLSLPPDLKHFIEEQKTKVPIPSPAAWFGEVLTATIAWASHIVELVLVPVLAFYFTLDGKTLRNQFLFLVPRDRLRQTLAIMSEGSAIMRAYIISQFWLAVIAGFVVGVGLSLLGMQYAVVLGLLAGITRAIPVIGPLIGGIPIVLLSFIYGAQHDNPFLWLWVLGFFTTLHLVESKIIMPRFLGHALNLHAVVIIVALLIGGEFFGLMGMFLAAPIAALIRLLLTHYVIQPGRRARTRPILTTVTGAGVGGTRVLRLERAVRAAASTVVLPASTKD